MTDQRPVVFRNSEKHFVPAGTTAMAISKFVPADFENRVLHIETSRPLNAIVRRYPAN